MDFIYKKDITFLKVCKQTGKITWFVENGSGCNAKINSQFIGYNGSQSGFSESGRTVKEDMIKSFSSLFCSSDKNNKVFNNLFLSFKVIKT